MTERDLIFVKASAQSVANQACQDAGLGPSTFTVGLVPTTRSPADPPATDYWCCTAFGSETRAALDAAGVAYRAHADSRGLDLAQSLAGKTPGKALASEALQRVQAAV